MQAGLLFFDSILIAVGLPMRDDCNQLEKQLGDF